jgi:hypothetical protein
MKPAGFAGVGSARDELPREFDAAEHHVRVRMRE